MIIISELPLGSMMMMMMMLMRGEKGAYGAGDATF